MSGTMSPGGSGRRRATGILPEEEDRIRSMFDAIAGQYDLLNRLITWNQDLQWRTAAARATRLPRGGRLLDVACGTADLIFSALDVLRPSVAVGLDFSPEMLAIAQRKAIATAVNEIVPLVRGTALRLPFPDGTFDAITCGFALRNFASIGGAFAEMARVLRPEGRAVILEVHRPAEPGAARLYDLYTSRIVPIIGAALSDGTAYRYLHESIGRFPDQAELLDLLRRSGFATAGGRLLGRGRTAQLLIAERGGG